MPGPQQQQFAHVPTNLSLGAGLGTAGPPHPGLLQQMQAGARGLAAAQAAQLGSQQQQHQQQQQQQQQQLLQQMMQAAQVQHVSMAFGLQDR